MPGIWTIARKEFRDHVSDRTFLLCFAALLIAMAGGALHFVQDIHDWNYMIVARGERIVEGWAWKTYVFRIVQNIPGQLSSLGALVAIALSFNSINKERTEGSLKVLLSYPIYRDKIILGKLLAGVTVISIVVVTSMTISFSIIVYSLSLPLTMGLLLRVAVTTVMGIILLSFFLCLGTAISTVLRDTSAILLCLLLISTVLRYETYRVILASVLNLLSVLGVNLKGPRRYVFTYFMPRGDPSFRVYARLSPVEAYIKLSERLFNMYEIKTISSGFIITPFQEQLYGNLDLVAVPIIFTIVAFIACYILFTRRDVA